MVECGQYQFCCACPQGGCCTPFYIGCGESGLYYGAPPTPPTNPEEETAEELAIDEAENEPRPIGEGDEHYHHKRGGEKDWGRRHSVRKQAEHFVQQHVTAFRVAGAALLIYVLYKFIFGSKKTQEVKLTCSCGAAQQQ